LGRKNSNNDQQQPQHPVEEEPHEHDHEYDHDQDHDHGDDFVDDDDDDRVVVVVDDDDDDGPPVGPPPPPTGPPVGPPTTSSTTTSPPPPRNLSDLTRPKRPIDPVFRSGVQYATFSKGGGGGSMALSSSSSSSSQQNQHQASSSINVFIPSAAPLAAAQQEEVEDDEEEETEDYGEGGESMQQQRIVENPVEEGDGYYGGGGGGDGDGEDDDDDPPPAPETETETFEQEQDGHYYHHNHEDEPTKEDDGNNNDNFGVHYEDDHHQQYRHQQYQDYDNYNDQNQNKNQYDDQQYDDHHMGGGEEEEECGTYEANNGPVVDDSQAAAQAQGYYGSNNNGDDGDDDDDDDKEDKNREDHYISDDGSDDDEYDEHNVDNVDRSMVEYTDENGQENYGGSENLVTLPQDADINIPSTPAAATGDDTSTSYETPSRSQQITVVEEQEKPTPSSSRFVFLSDQKRLPTDLRRLQERTLKRRRELLTRMHDLDCQAARLTSQLADEQMDFHLAIHDSFERTVQQPLTSAMERITIDKDSSSNPMIVRSLERRLCDIDVGMTRHVHETMCETKRDKLESIHDGLQQGIVSELRMENIKYDKVEGGIVRRFEQVAGSLASGFQKEAAERRGQTELLQRKVELTAKVEATERLQHKLVLIQSLREQLKAERTDRRQNDQRIRTEINEGKVRIERAMLAAFETEL